MLLDKYVLTKAFENLLSFHNSSSTPHVPAAGFVKRVNNTMTRIDPLLKTLQVRPSPPEGLVQAYLIHIGDKSDTNFKKILDLKGVRKMDQSHLLELFQIHREGSTNDKLVAQSPLLTPLMNASAAGNTVASINSGSALMGAPGATRFDAASLGEKLLSAARDGVERIGTPGQQSAAGQQAATTMNENLKNFGKFFRRDIGGLGARFGKSDESGR
jgi:vacuolar protein sorting-associated protein 53